MPAYKIYFSYVGIRWLKRYSVTGPLPTGPNLKQCLWNVPHYAYITKIAHYSRTTGANLK